MKKKDIPGTDILRPAIIDDFSAPTRVKKHQPFEITVSGHFSNLGWQMAEAKAIVKRRIIILSVIGKTKSGIMSAQALKPYTTTIPIRKLKRGKYIIKAQKGTKKELELIVK
jgi:hypothetical protein